MARGRSTVLPFAPALAASLLALLGLIALTIVAALGGQDLAGGVQAGAGSVGASTLARTEIPPLYLSLYERAGARYGVDWAILAGIGKVECDHGRAPAPSCAQEGVVNSAGAGGPMQFIASTWSRYGVAAEGDARPDRWNVADAILSAANYLHAAGAPRSYSKAIYAYNHARWYVAEVEAWASRYRAAAAPFWTGSVGNGAAAAR